MNREGNIASEQPEGYHTPVMMREAVDALDIKPDGTYVDCTFGGGGHSREILSRLGTRGHLIAFDQDEDARRNLPDDERLIFVPHNFRHLQRFLKLHQFPQVDGILADLGVSSHQFDQPSRGFSIRFDAPLDMRMDKKKQETAALILEQYDERRLQKIFQDYGEVTNARTLARTIADQQGTGRLATVSGFREAIAGAVKGNPNKYLAQVFQALRMEVNDEMGSLQDLLRQLPEALKPGGRAAIITFHSLEDRAVKNFFRHGRSEEDDAADMFGTKPEKLLVPVNKKPLVPGEEELKRNPRSRSAKLRIAEKPVQ